MSSALIAVTAALTVNAPARAQDPVPSPAFERPAYQPLRFREDWSGLRGLDPDATGDRWDPVKYVPMSGDGAIWASIGGEARLRSETWSDFAFGAPGPDDDTFLLWRLLLHADVHFGENVRAFVQGKSALSTDRDLPGGRRTLDVDTLALEQAFVDLRIPLHDDASLTLRPGRQQLAFGKQRLVSPLGWSNTLRRWDGLSAILECGDWRVHGFVTQFAPVQKYGFNDPDAQNAFLGIYATTPLGDSGVGLDAYVLGLDRDDAVAFNGTVGDEERWTVGGRVFGTFGGGAFDYDVEGAYQFGEVGAGDVSAFMVGSAVGWRPGGAGTSTRLWLGFDYGSGDDEPGGDVETFNQLFPLGHAYLGYMDFVGRQNVVDFSGGISFAPAPKATLAATGHLFRRASDDDALYNAGGGVVRPGGASSSRDVGSEIDLTLTYRFDRHLVGEVGYSHFFTDDFIEESGSSDDMDFLYVQLTYTF